MANANEIPVGTPEAAKLMRTHVRALDHQSLRMARDFEQTASEILGKKVSLALPFEERVRLLNLRVLTMETRLPLREILSLLFEEYSPKKGKYRRTALPAPIRVLTSDSAMAWCLARVRELYRGANIAAWKSQTRLLQVSRKMHPSMVEDPEEFAEEYKAQLLQLRTGFEETTTAKRRRNYRGNPWR